MPRFTGKVSFVTKPDKTLHARATYVNRQGKRKEKWARVWTTKAAAKEAVIAKIEKALVEEDESGVLTFRQLADQYTETYAIAPVYVHDEKVKGMEAWRQVRSVVNDLAAYFGETPLDWITRGTILVPGGDGLRGSLSFGQNSPLVDYTKEPGGLRGGVCPGSFSMTFL